MEQDTNLLDQLIFREVEKIWNQVISEGRPDNPAPNTLYVLDCANANWNRMVCHPPVIRAWQYDRAGQRTEISLNHAAGNTPLAHVLEAQKYYPGRMFYDSGVFKFHIATDRQLLVIHYNFGPRYGAGWVAKVSGEGELATLEEHPAFGKWAA